MNIWITGCNGFIGSCLTKHLMKKNWNVLGLDKNKSKEFSAPEFSFRQVDLTAPLEQSLGRLLASVDCVIHCAGKSSVLQSMEDPHTDYLSGPVATHNMLEAIRLYGKPSTSFIFLSSAAVYGNPSEKPTSELCPTKPISPYGFHKLQCEQIADMYASVFKIQSTSLRIFSAYGADLKRQVVYDLAKKIYSAKNGSDVEIFGTGNESRDFIHISDICKTVELVAASTKVYPCLDIINLGSGQETSIRNLAENLIAFFNKKIHLKFTLEKATGMPDNWCADISKLNKIGITPQRNLTQFLEEYSFL